MSQTSHVVAEDPVVDLAIVEAMASELEEYIVKDDLYRTLIASTPRGEQRLKMTGGDLLVRLHRLRGATSVLSTGQQSRLEQLQTSVQETAYALRTRFHERLAREISARADALKWYLDDLAGDVKQGRANFAYEIRNRQRIEVIRAELENELPEEVAAKVNAVDRRIRQVTRSSDFIWDERLRPIYPPSNYWFLYVTP